MLKKLVVLFISSLVIAFLVWRFVPSHVYRRGGTMDVVMMVDTSGSFASNLPASKTSGSTLINGLLPGDSFALFTVGRQVKELYRGVVGKGTAGIVKHQINSLLPMNEEGTAIYDALEKGARTFEEFTGSSPSSLEHRRVFVGFSDYQANTGATSSAPVFFPSLTTIVAIGMNTQDDRLIRTLQGAGGNDIHIVTMDEAKGALDATLKVFKKAHPLNIPILCAIIAVCGLCVLLIFFVSGRVEKSKPSGFEVLLQLYGQSETEQVFSLYNGDSLVIGGNGSGADFRVPAPVNCTLTKTDSDLCVTPMDGNIAIRRQGEYISVESSAPIKDGDILVLTPSVLVEVGIQKD